MTCWDVHTHVVPACIPELPRGIPSGDVLRIVPDGEQRRVHRADRELRTVAAEAWNPEARLRAMDATGVGHQVLLPTPFTFLYDAAPEYAAWFARLQNEFIADFVEDDPGRFVGFGSIPLQDPPRAVAEVSRIAKMGLGGVEIGTHTPRFDLDAPDLAPVFSTIEDCGLAVFVHPWARPTTDEPMERLGLGFGLGYPTATARAGAVLLWGGVLDRHPNLRICLAHAGGCLPAIAGRLAHGWHHLPGRRGQLRREPREALRSFWADTLSYDPASLLLAADVFGPDHLVPGTDFPFGAREEPPTAVLDAAVADGWLQAGTAEAIRSRHVPAFLHAGVGRE